MALPARGTRAQHRISHRAAANRHGPRGARNSQSPIQPASRLNSSLGGAPAGWVNFAALLLCLVLVIISLSHAPSAAFRLVLESCVMRVPTRQSITSAKDLCIVRSVDFGLIQTKSNRKRFPHGKLWTIEKTIVLAMFI